jgi:signal transduction histidine kinase
VNEAAAERKTTRRTVSLRWRITIAFLGGALAVSALVAGTTYVLTERYLLRQRIDDAVQQAFTNVRFATRQLSSAAVDPESEESLNDLLSLLEARGSFEVMLVQRDLEVQPLEWFPTSISLTPGAVPDPLREAVENGSVGYAFRGDDELVFGSPVPNQRLQMYLFFPLGDLRQTLTVVRNVLLGVSASAVGLAALVGTRVSARVVNPVRRVSRAARRVAEGLLETRLPVLGEDEVGALAASFNEMAAALEDRITRERRFVGDVSHELRTPLTTLRTSTDYLLEHSEGLPPHVRRAAELLAADVVYLQRLADDLLDLSRVDAGRIEMSWERLSLADLAREVVARRSRGSGQEVRVELEVEPEDLSTVADKRRLERVVGNLVDNALIHGGGQDVTVRLDKRDGILLLSVEDHGPGVPPQVAGRIFERFFKADPARHRNDRGGSGLGLAIARENAHLHGGEILVFNHKDRGARFTLQLPRRDQEPEST